MKDVGKLIRARSRPDSKIVQLLTLVQRTQKQLHVILRRTYLSFQCSQTHIRHITVKINTEDGYEVISAAMKVGSTGKWCRLLVCLPFGSCWLLVLLSSTLIMVAVCNSETSVNSYRATCGQNPDDSTINIQAFFLVCIVGGGIKVHSTLRPLNGLLCQSRVIMIMEKSVEW
jgi:hypothetical protein